MTSVAFNGAPRFNMPFEVGLAVATARWRPARQRFLLEARPYRVQQTLSDLGGTDAYIHGDGPRRLLIALADAGCEILVEAAPRGACGPSQRPGRGRARRCPGSRGRSGCRRR